MRLQVLFLVATVLMAFQSSGQAGPGVKFGKINPADFKTKSYKVDSSAYAVIIADIGSTNVVGNDKGWFSLESKCYRRAHVLHKNGYDAANITIYLYTDDGVNEEVLRLKAVTYNLENGNVVKTSLDQHSGLFKEKLSKRVTALKFTFPNVREGSIIEFEYTKVSDFLLSMDPWEFQGEYPRLWSEYTFGVPAFFNYVFLYQGHREFDIRDVKKKEQTFYVGDARTAAGSSRSMFVENINLYRWAMKDVPALKEESYTSALKNHVSRVEFQLIEQREPLEEHKYFTSWEQFTSDLLKAEYFGEALSRDNGWIGDYISPITRSGGSELEIARKIYEYVRDHYTCTNHNSRGMIQTLRAVARSRNGNVAEINLLLAAMMKHAGIPADPVLLSTRSHGYIYATYPLPDRLNYVICRVTVGGKYYYLDASQPLLGFGKLEYECYNGHARVVDEKATPLEFLADSLTEMRSTSIFMVNDDRGGFTGSMQQTPGYFQSLSLRKEMAEGGKQQLAAQVRKSFGNAEVEIEEPTIDALKDYEKPLEIKLEFRLNKPSDDVFYFNPLFNEGWKENPFKATQRYYPVEMPYTIDETFLLRMDVPKDYVIDELPRQLLVKLNPEGDGVFEYRIGESNGIISVRSRLKITRTFFHPDEYDMLRKFFNLVVKKHSEQIVFKKKK
jgi:hypothetical protein